jgi:hypothetical protein
MSPSEISQPAGGAVRPRSSAKVGRLPAGAARGDHWGVGARGGPEAAAFAGAAKAVDDR